MIRVRVSLLACLLLGLYVGTPGQAAASFDSGDLIDLMIVFTPDAVTRAGGTAELTERVLNDVHKANAGLADSGAAFRLRLVHTYQTNYDETFENNDLAGILSTLQSNRDQVMDDVHVFRDQYGADLVALVVDTNPSTDGTCVKANKPVPPTATTDDAAFSVISVLCLNTINLAHGIGHNLGASHNISDLEGLAHSENAYGYRKPGYFRTIMALPCADDGLAACPVINRWSNPDRTYSGQTPGGTRFTEPTGTTEANNISALNAAAPIVANYRQAQTLTPGILIEPNGTLTATETITLRWYKGGEATHYTVQVFDPYGVDLGGEVAANTCSNGECSLDVIVNGIVGTYTVTLQTHNGVTTTQGASTHFSLKLGESAIQQPVHNTAATSTFDLVFERTIGAYYYVIDLYRPASYERFVVNADDICSGDTCTYAAATADEQGVFSIWLIPGVGPYFGDWTSTTFTVGLEAIGITAPTGMIPPAASATLTFPAPTAAAYTVLDLYPPHRPFEFATDRFIVETADCSSVCSVTVPIDYVTGTYGLWTITGIGADTFGMWTYHEFTVGWPPITLTYPTQTVPDVGLVSLIFPANEGAAYYVVDVYRPNHGFDPAADRYVIEADTCNATCGVQVPTHNRAGDWSIWIIPGIGPYFGSWGQSSFTITPADSINVDVLGSAGPPPPHQDGLAAAPIDPPPPR